MITLYKINSKYYDYKTFLRKYIPYVIRWDINNNYYIVNRDYEYIGLNSKSIDYTREGEACLFNDGNKPWDNRNNYIRLIKIIDCFIFYNELDVLKYRLSILNETVDRIFCRKYYETI